MEMIDFIPADYKSRGLRGNFRVFEFSILLLIILILFLNIFLYFKLASKKKTVADELEVASARLEIVDRRLENFHSQDSFKTQFNLTPLMEKLKELLPQGLIIDSFIINEDKSFEFRGQLSESDKFFQLMDKISNSAYFQKVMIEHSLEDREDKLKLIKFKIRGEITQVGR